jgi:hypothetical protein
VKPSECVEVTEKWQNGAAPDVLESLIWLYPQRHREDYIAMREELARGDDAFKLD